LSRVIIYGVYFKTTLRAGPLNMRTVWTYCYTFAVQPWRVIIYSVQQCWLKGTAIWTWWCNDTII